MANNNFQALVDIKGRIASLESDVQNLIKSIDTLSVPCNFNINLGDQKQITMGGIDNRSEARDPRDVSDMGGNFGNVYTAMIDHARGVLAATGIAVSEIKEDIENYPINPEEKDRTPNYSLDGSAIVSQASPCIWTGEDNWCGLNYFPPNGSRALSSSGMGGKPIVTGYLPENPEIIRPILSAGEMCLKGMGNNYIHLRTSDKIDLHASSTSGAQDYDDLNGEKTTEGGSSLWIRMSANDGQMKLTASGDGGTSCITIRNEVITITSPTIRMIAESLIDMQAPQILQHG